MIVHKFGGASIKNADSIRNLTSILKSLGEKEGIIVVSALGKTTNELEKILKSFWNKDGQCSEMLASLRDVHEGIINELWPDGDGPLDELNDLFVELEWAIEDEPREDYNYEYDQIVSFGELFSTTIVSAYLNYTDFQNSWIDARDLIKTDNNYRDARVDMELTAQSVESYIVQGKWYLTQGFIGCTSENFNSTLGREGSDYSAAIFANLLKAEKLIVWKDVPGLMNGDPKEFSNTVTIPHLSYADAIELAFYGAKVIHPRTIQPLKAASIPLYIRSFIDVSEEGTCIQNGLEQDFSLPFFIKRKDQVLISIRDQDLDFVAEDHLSEIFAMLSKYRFRVRLMQNSAVSFSVVGDHQEFNLKNLIKELSKSFKVRFNDGLSLFTIRNYREEDIVQTIGNSKLILEQRTRSNVQLLVKEEA